MYVWETQKSKNGYRWVEKFGLNRMSKRPIRKAETRKSSVTYVGVVGVVCMTISPCTAKQEQNIDGQSVAKLKEAEVIIG